MLILINFCDISGNIDDPIFLITSFRKHLRSLKHLVCTDNPLLFIYWVFLEYLYEISETLFFPPESVQCINLYMYMLIYKMIH